MRKVLLRMKQCILYPGIYSISLENISCFASLGIQITKKIDKLGMRSSDTAQVFFEDVRVPQTNIIGEEGQGFTYQMLQFQEERLWGAAASKYKLTLSLYLINIYIKIVIIC